MEYLAVIGFVVLAFIVGAFYGYNLRTREVPYVEPPPKPEATAGEIVQKKRVRSIRLHKSPAELRADFEAKHNTKEQRAQRLAKEIEDVASRKVDA